jgi:hypothetical protein
VWVSSKYLKQELQDFRHMFRRMLLAATMIAGFAVSYSVNAQTRVGPVPSTNGTLVNPNISGGTITGADSSAATVTATGAPTSTTLAALAAQQGVLLDSFKQISDPDDTASLTRALTAGVPILLGPRVYSVHDFSTSVSTFILKGVPGRSIIQRNGATNPTGSFFAITSKTVIIDGVTFDANKAVVSSNQWGVILSGGGQNVSIKHSVFEHNSGNIGACLIILGTGITAGGSFNISENEVTDCTLQAVYIGGATNGIINDNWVHDVTGFGIFVGNNSGNPAQDIGISRNHVFRSNSTGISVGGIASPFVFGTPSAINVQVSNNFLQDNIQYGISLEGDYCDAIGNVIDQSSPSVHVLGAIDTLGRFGKIQNNTVVFSGITFAIDIGGSQAFLVTGNSVTMDQGSAYNTGGNVGTVVRDNIANLSGTAFGVTNYAIEGTGSGQTFPNRSSSTVIENNTFNMVGSGTVGIAMFDNAGGGVNGAGIAATPNSIDGNHFNVSGSGSGPFQDIHLLNEAAHSILLGPNNTHNNGHVLFSDPVSGSPSDIQFDYVNFGGTIQGISSTNAIRSFVTRDIETYGSGGSVISITPSNPGTGYVQATTTITITGTGCTGQVATPQVNQGNLIGVRLSNGGSGCSGTVTATATDTSGGSGAVLVVQSVPVMPDLATINYISPTQHLLQASGGFVGLQPGIPLALSTVNGPVQLQVSYGGTAWRVIGYTPGAFTVAQLLTCNTAAKGALAYVTDATAPTFGGTITGGGTVRIKAQCDGTNWLSYGV